MDQNHLDPAWPEYCKTRFCFLEDMIEDRCNIKRMQEKKNKLLTCSIPQPVGMTARMQIIRSLIVILATAINTMRMARNVMKIEPSINLNTSWKSALRRRLPTDIPCKNAADNIEMVNLFRNHSNSSIKWCVTDGRKKERGFHDLNSHLH